MLGDPITDLTIAMELNYFQLNSADYFVPVAMKIPGNELVLAQKAGAQLFGLFAVLPVSPVWRQHHLQRDMAMQPGVFGLVNFAHSAHSKM